MPYCKNCGEDIGSSWSYCSVCGQDLLKPGNISSGRGRSRKVIVWLLAIALLVVGASALLYLQYYPPIIAVPGKYATIQAAVDAAREGRIIVVEPGLYQENIDFKGKAITLRSTNPDDLEVVAATIIDGDGNGSVVTFQNGENEEAVLSGFTITGGGGTWLELEHGEEVAQVKQAGHFGGGILVLNGSSPTITNNIIRDNTCAGEGGGGGLAIWNASAKIAGNTVSGNRALNGGGIFVGGGSYAAVERNTIIENKAVNGGGIFVIIESSVVLEENNISGNRAE